MLILIFSDHYAAKHISVPLELSVEADPGLARETAQRHAQYIYDAIRHEDYLLIIPDGIRPESSNNTRIDLPISSPPKCRLEANGRCLLVLPYSDFETYDLTGVPPGSVTLTGTIDRDGKIVDVRAVDVHVSPPESGQRLALAAARNLRGWQFEPGKRKDALRVEYSYGAAGTTEQSHPIIAPPFRVRIIQPSGSTPYTDAGWRIYEGGRRSQGKSLDSSWLLFFCVAKRAAPLSRKDV